MNNTARIQGLNYKEALSLINYSKVSKRNRDLITSEIKGAVVERLENDYRLDHALILENYAEIIQQQEREENLRKEDSQRGQRKTIQEAFTEKHQAELAVGRLNEKLGLERRTDAFLKIARRSPELLKLMQQ